MTIGRTHPQRLRVSLGLILDPERANFRTLDSGLSRISLFEDRSEFSVVNLVKVFDHILLFEVLSDRYRAMNEDPAIETLHRS